LIRFSPISLVIIGLAALPALLTALAQATLGLAPGTAEIINWTGAALAMLVLLGEGIRRFRRRPAGRKGKQGERPA